MGFTKLDSEITKSSIWSESSDTRIVWITFLAEKDQNGFVGGSIPGLARLANVSIDAFKIALECLEGPDPYSRTTDNDGRRIEKVDGGWTVLNHKKYREYSYSSNPDAIRMREKRKEEKTNNPEHVRDVRNISVSVSASVSEERKTIPPKIEWVTCYCSERSNNIDPKNFFDFYESKGWKVGKTKMIDWQACIRTWEKGDKHKQKESGITW